jgi:lysophospholipase L1-like esterase
MALASFTASRRWNGSNSWDEMSDLQQNAVMIQPRSQARIMIIGHSFITRLSQFLDKNEGRFHNYHLEYDQVNVKHLGKGGKTVTYARYMDLSEVSQYKPHIVYIELGSNDLSKKNGQPEVIASELHEFANDLLGIGVIQVIIGQVLHRKGRGIPHRLGSYNLRVTTFNNICKALFDSSISPGCYFWQHISLYKKEHTIQRDGVHLTDIGQKRLFRSIRGALLRSLTRV